ncbi:MAG: 3-deoxy-manno-octulosonate cytidylyltransferase [Fimbriimonadaceae bacterium]|nr:3-deoxy-manno-octulosonate cytidylyltransferase [Fimbriimonadaceae bacterium]
MDCVIVVPARMASTRFPGKPLVDLCGKPMIQWVCEAASESGMADRIIVATPDQEIIEACVGFGTEAMLTSYDHPSGTDRVAEVARAVGANYYVNVQGDEPLINPITIRRLARLMVDDPKRQVATSYCECPSEEEENPAVVKVVTDGQDRALYFSRYPIPFPRNQRRAPLKKHIGIYAYRQPALEQFTHWAMGDLEQSESLEQLRFLENGVGIAMSEGIESELAVDTPEQAEEVRGILSARMRRTDSHADH